MELQVPSQGERLFVVGNSGTGKSKLLRTLFLSVKHGIVADTKEDPDDRGEFSELGSSNGGKPVRGDDIFEVGNGRYWWQPGDAYLDDLDRWDRYFAWLLKGGKRAHFQDEWGDVCPDARTYPPALRRCILRGRSRELSIWGTTQELVRVPPFLYSQAQHRYTFHLAMDYQKLGDQFMEARVPWEAMPEPSPHTRAAGTAYRFCYRGPGTGLLGPMKLREESLASSA